MIQGGKGGGGGDKRGASEHSAPPAIPVGAPSRRSGRGQAWGGPITVAHAAYYGGLGHA